MSPADHFPPRLMVAQVVMSIHVYAACPKYSYVVEGIAISLGNIATAIAQLENIVCRQGPGIG